MMKELSIEEKAKAYDEALEKAKIWQKHLYDVNDKDYADELNYIFPELKESEDERVRNKLIEFFKGYYPDEEWWGNITQEDILAWLGKQGEPKEINPSEFDSQLNRLLGQFKSLPKEELASSLSFYLNVVQNNGTYKEEKQGEQKPTDKVEPKFKAGDVIRHKEQGFTCKIIAVDTEYRLSECSGTHLPFDSQDAYELVEQKPWNEEDEDMINSIIRELIHQYNEEIPQGTEDKIKWLKNKLKSLRPQNWTKEDKERYKSCLQKLGTGNPEQPETINSKWFKEHVYPKPQWKPSEEQLSQLYYASTGISYSRVTLISLLEQLRKLKG